MLQKPFSEDILKNDQKQNLIDRLEVKKHCHCYNYVFSQEEKMLVAQ